MQRDLETRRVALDTDVFSRGAGLQVTDSLSVPSKPPRSSACDHEVQAHGPLCPNYAVAFAFLDSNHAGAWGERAVGPGAGWIIEAGTFPRMLDRAKKGVIIGCER